MRAMGTKSFAVSKGNFLNNPYVDDFRFDGDYNNFIDVGTDGTHPGPKHNKSYVNKLYNHLIDMDVIDSIKVELTDYTKDYIFEPTGKTPMDNFLEPNKLI